MSWLLKQAEEILNRVDQQTNAALHQPSPKAPRRDHEIEFITDLPSVPANPSNLTISSAPSISAARTPKKPAENDLINYLNGSTESKRPTRLGSSSKRLSTSSVPASQPLLVTSHNEATRSVSPIEGPPEHRSQSDLTSSLQTENQRLRENQQRCEEELYGYKRQLIQYQQQIAESDALLRDLRSRESDSNEILSAKDSQLALLRHRLTESEELLRTAQSTRPAQDPVEVQTEAVHSLQMRLAQVEEDLQMQLNENERLNEEKYRLETHQQNERLRSYEDQQQNKHTKSLLHQMEEEMKEYKAKAQRILQAKDQLIVKLKDIAQQRSSTPTMADQYGEISRLIDNAETSGPHSDSTLLDVSHVGTASMSVSKNWMSVQYEELKGENDLFKQELQARELTINNLRHELHEVDAQSHQTNEQLHEHVNQLSQQLKDERARSILIEQDYRRLKQDVTAMQDEYQRHKQLQQGQITERERDLERLRSQLTAKTINRVNDEALEKRLQTLTESLLHKQAIIEGLQTEKSSLKLQLERFEKRLDDYETIARSTRDSLPNTTRFDSNTAIAIDENDSNDNLRHRLPLLRETPFDVHLTKKVKRAANELDQLAIRLTIFLRRYPIVRLAVLCYVLLLHLWTFIVLCTHTPTSHLQSDLKDKL